MSWHVLDMGYYPPFTWKLLFNIYLSWMAYGILLFSGADHMTGNVRRSAIEAMEDLILVVQIIRLHQGQGEEDILGIYLVFIRFIELLFTSVVLKYNNWKKIKLLEGQWSSLHVNQVASYYCCHVKSSWFLSCAGHCHRPPAVVHPYT